MNATRLATAAVATFLLGGFGCNFPTAEQWLPPAEITPFSVAAVNLPIADSAQPQPRDPIIEIIFSDYPDANTFSFPALRLGPRGQSIQYSFSVSLIDKSVVIRPRDRLLPDTDYFVFLDSGGRSLAGQPLASDEPLQLSFHTGTQLSPPSPTEPTVTLTELLSASGALQKGCARAGCHSSQGGLVPARGIDFSGTVQSVKAMLLSSRRFGPTRLLLVEPGRPETSYLLRKLLARTSGGFLQIDGEPMPPPAATDLAPLAEAELRTIATWIRQGAH